MQEMHLYEYAVIRVVPKVEREEFLNVGIILFSKRNDFLKAKYELNTHKLKTFAPELDLNLLAENLKTFDRICSGEKSSGVLAAMETPDRFRWLTAEKSTIIQTSRPHPGFTKNLDQEITHLFEEFVQ